jgi:hypothetical protein
MSEPAAPQPPDLDTNRPLPSVDSTVPPLPYPGVSTARPLSSGGGVIPPMPSETAYGHAQGDATSKRWRTAVMQLRKIMRRTPPRPV